MTEYNIRYKQWLRDLETIRMQRGFGIYKGDARHKQEDRDD